jgi:hypothetical protein
VQTSEYGMAMSDSYAVPSRTIVYEISSPTRVRNLEHISFPANTKDEDEERRTQLQRDRARSDQREGKRKMMRRKEMKKNSIK